MRQEITEYTREINDSDVYRAAHLMISEFGPMADVSATAVAEELSRRGDHDASRRWLKVVQVVNELQEQIGPHEGESLH